METLTGWLKAHNIDPDKTMVQDGDVERHNRHDTWDYIDLYVTFVETDNDGPKYTSRPCNTCKREQNVV